MFTLTEDDATVLVSLQVGDTVLQRNSYGWGPPRWRVATITRLTATMLVLEVSRYQRVTGRRVGATNPWTDRVFPDTPKFREQMVKDETARARRARLAAAKHALHHRIKWDTIPLEVVERAVEVLGPFLRPQGS